MAASAPSPSPSTTGSISRRAVVGGLATGAALAVTSGSAIADPRGGGHHAADLVLLDGDVRLLDRRGRRAQALAVRSGRVVEVGSTREVRRLVGRRTRVVDLDGRTALPGINDSHVHGLAAGVSLPPLSLDVGYPTVLSIADIVAAVEEAVATQPAGTWIRGSGWNTALLEETRLDPTRPLTRQDLDAVSPDHPVALRDFSYHAVWANTRAIEAAGITATTPDPPGGHIEREPDGTPRGVFLETAQVLILEAMPPLSIAEQSAGLERAIGVLLSQGITSYTDPGLTAEEIGVYRDAADRGALRSRVALMLTSSDSLATGGTGGGSVAALAALMEEYPRPQVFARGRLELRGVKIFADGIPPNHSAWLYEPYVDVGGVGGLVVAGDTDEERVAQVRGIVSLAHRAGFQVGTHATGDRTLDVVTAAYLRALRRGGPRDPRHYTIHSDLVSDPTLRRLAAHGLGVNMNPSIKAAIADAMIGVLGEERAARQWPMRSARDAGVTLTSASDWPVTPPDWRAGVVAAVLRQDLVSGNVSGPEERVTIEDALRSYTAAPAYQDGAERWKGRLLPGMVADVCVLDGRIPDVDEEVEALGGIPVAMTVFDGEVAYERSSGTTGPGSAAATAAAASAGCAHGATCCCTRAPELLAGWA